MRNKIESKEFYNNFAETYNEYADKRNLYHTAINNEVLTEAKQGAWLDVGVGTGVRLDNILKQLKWTPDYVVGVDESLSMREKARKIKSIQQLFLLDIADNNTVDATLGMYKFHTITCLFNVLGHLNSHKKRVASLRNIRHLLTPGGVLIFDVNNRYNMRAYGIRNVMRNIWKDISKNEESTGDFPLQIKSKYAQDTYTMVHIFTKQEVIKMLHAAGYTKFNIHFKRYDTGKAGCQTTGQIVVIAQM